MPKRKPKGQQIDTINRQGDLFQASFDLKKMDQFVTSLGVQFVHYKALPSPIGLKERGGYRRSDGVDTISSNGFIYKKSGLITGVLLGNSDGKRFSESAMLDESNARLVMPRFYDKQGEVAEGQRIYMTPGDRVYINDPHADIKVANFQRMEYSVTGLDIPMFPIEKMEFLQDSQGKEYFEGLDFKITPDGNIKWLQSGSNPGVDLDTGKGRVYSIRYLYRAFFYVTQLVNEVRITNTTKDSERSPERLPYQVVLVREYVYHNQNNSQTSELKPEDAKRTIEAPRSLEIPSRIKVKVNMDDFED